MDENKKINQVKAGDVNLDVQLDGDKLVIKPLDLVSGLKMIGIIFKEEEVEGKDEYWSDAYQATFQFKDGVFSVKPTRPIKLLQVSVHVQTDIVISPDEEDKPYKEDLNK
jgi:sirohydrochlorin ferrochelatase